LHPGYQTPRWRAISQAQLAEKPNCEDCEKRGIQRVADACGHVIPSWAAPEKFYDGPFVSQCRSCNARQGKADEKRYTRKPYKAPPTPLVLA
jgi:5-methylcytosine-specific restriction endonuclease McrA